MTSLDHLLADAGRVDDISTTSLAQGRAMLDEAVASPARHSPRRTARLAAIAAAVAATVVTIPLLAGTGDGPSASAAVLRQAGAAAGSQPGGWPDAAYWHVASSYVREGKTYRRDIWIAHRGHSVLRDDGLPGQAGLLPVGNTFPAGGTSLSWDQLYALPTEAGALRSVLRSDIKGAGPDPTTELFVAVGDLLRESPAPPALRQALYDVAAGIHGVRVTGHVTDAAGRTGTALTYGDETYVIDPGNGQLLAGTEPGWSATYLSQGPADSAPRIAK
jgi:hypothetical protein